MHRTAMGNFRGGSNPLAGQLEIVDWRLRSARIVLDGAAGDTRLQSEMNGVGYSGRIVGETVFQVGRHGQGGDLDQRSHVRHDVITIDRPVEKAQGRGEPAAGRAQGFESQPR